MTETDPTAYVALRDLAAETGSALPTLRRAARLRGIPLWRLLGDRKLYILVADAERLQQPVMSALHGGDRPRDLADAPVVR